MGRAGRGLVRTALGDRGVFRLLKMGTRIETRRLRDAAALGKCLVFDAITAWRVFSLDRYARDAPETPARAAQADELAVSRT